MKKYLLVLFQLFLVASGFIKMGWAQTPTDGDYRTAKALGVWTDADMWEVRSGGVWTVTATPPSSLNNVYIQQGHEVALAGASAVLNLHFNVDPVAPGRLLLNEHILSVHGKMRGYLGAVEIGAAEGSFYTQTSTSTGYSNQAAVSTTGHLRITGTLRRVFNTGEWGASGFAACDLVFEMNSPADTAQVETPIKFKNITIKTGSSVSAGTTARISADDGNTTGQFIIQTGARFVSTRSGVTSQIVAGANSTTRCGTVLLESGAIMELYGSAPAFDATNVTLEGTVIYARAGSQTLLQRGVDAGSAIIAQYQTLVLAGTNSKTAPNPIQVAQRLRFAGSATLVVTAVNTLTLANQSTVERGATGTSLPSTAGAVFYGTDPAHVVNVDITLNNNNSNELPSAPTPGRVGTLTIASGVTYTITGSRAVTNLLLNGTLALLPSTTLTLTVNGTIGGPGSVTGNASASVTFAGSVDGPVGTLRFTPGSQIANNLTINRTGLNAVLELATPVSLSPLTGSGNLQLTAGTLDAGTNTITVGGNLSGSGVCLHTGAGRIVMSGRSGLATISSPTVTNLELNDADGFATSGSPTITGTLTLTTGVLTISASNTLTMESGASIGGAPFNSAKYVRCELTTPDIGKLVVKNITTLMSLPIGTLSQYLPIQLTPTSASDFQVAVFTGITADGLNTGTPLTLSERNDLVDAVWTIDRLAGTGDCVVTFQWEAALEGAGFSALANNEIGIARHDGASWGFYAGVGDNSANTATRTISTFSPFSVGKVNSPLPITLTNWHVTDLSSAVRTEWTVTDDRRVRSYTVERSYNGQSFESVARLVANGQNRYTVTDNQPYAGTSFYRLRIEGITGEIRYSSILRLQRDRKLGVQLYPSPAQHELVLSGLQQSAFIRIVDSKGVVSLNRQVLPGTLRIPIEKLSRGAYWLQVIAQDGSLIEVLPFQKL